MTIPAPATVAGGIGAEREVRRLRRLLETIADGIDLAIDGDWREATDLLLDLSDAIRAELRP